MFEIIGKPARTKTCEAMQGLTAEMEEDLEDFGDSPAADAVLIACAQAVEHYEIARYGTLKTWAGQLGFGEAARLLDETLAGREEDRRTPDRARGKCEPGRRGDRRGRGRGRGPRLGQE